MPSLRPSQYAMQQRTDGGPFLRIERDDLEYDTDEVNAPQEGDGEFEWGMDQIYGASRVYYSDVALPNDSLGWHLILEVTPDDLIIHPIYPRSTHPQYGEPRYDTIKSIIITRPVYQPYAHPSDKYDVEELLGGLPAGLSKDWRYGLGFHYEYRYIVNAVASLEGVKEIMLHGERGRNDARVKGSTYFLGVDQLEVLRKRLDQLTQRHQRETAADKKLVCYTGLLHKAAPELYPPRARKLAPDMLANLVSLGSVTPQLSPKDQQQAAKLAQQSVPTLAKSEPRTLFNLKAEIELVTLGQLIEVYRKMMDSNANETRWQAFLSKNPFILDMAFGYPVKKIADQPYVGGKNFSGRGGQYSDFLMAAKATGNLALIEIKHPQHDLLGKQYRKTYTPSYELSGSVGQIISQRSHVQREIYGLAHDLKERVHAHAVAAIVIIGRTPEEEDKQEAFEQYRNGLKDVLVVTFDELQDRLESIHRALTPPTLDPEAKPELIRDEDLPF
ncbi:Shedu immune nuclease family protein [Pseudomonas sp. NPDC087817]|uniref:Shedu immune nuclease family protein n=1 Tax=Pseudomonas sp. NPDC087817 TaxID=3364451 RepID=UPI00381BFB7C